VTDVEIAELLHLRGENARALELVLLAQQHPASWQRTRDEAERWNQCLQNPLLPKTSHKFGKKCERLIWRR
jgi:hypothetical protein